MKPDSPPYLNRELSWLEYNQRFLDEASDSAIPLLERLQSLALTALHLDEFFMVRVGALKVLASRGQTVPDLAGMSPAEQLEAIRGRTRRMSQDQYARFAELEQRLAEAGIQRLSPAELSDRQARMVEQVFEGDIASVLAPQAVPTVANMPPLVNQIVIVAVRLKTATGSRYVVIPFGGSPHRFLTLYSEGGYAYLLLEDALSMFLYRLFPSEEVQECVPFRLTRHADQEVRRDLAGDLLAQLPAEADVSWEQDCVRLEIDERASDELVEFLQAASHVSDDGVFRCSGPVDLAAFGQLHKLPGFEKLKYEAWPAQSSPQVDLTNSMFETLAGKDVLLHHPYDSFLPVIRLIEEAADDPDVVAIKQTLYGTDRDSPIIEALIRAAENDKYVTAIVELKPRFRDTHKREWARSLEQAGIQVIYGIEGLKTHAKLCVVVRREPTGIQPYVHFGTGDYSQTTAERFSDVSLLTSHEDLGADAIKFFNSITSYSYAQEFRRIDAAPAGLRNHLIEMIQTEARRKEQGQLARITAKMNALGDPAIIDALYAAARRGVEIRLIVCGLCCLRPGIPGLSDNIQVVSIVDRFREHARLFHFHHGGDERVFISSADWMPRNLDRRVELLVPVTDATAKKRLIWVLDTYLMDNVKSAYLQPDGTWTRTMPPTTRARVRSQEVLYRAAVAAVRQAEQSRRTVFEPHRAPDTPSS